MAPESAAAWPGVCGDWLHFSGHPRTLSMKIRVVAGSQKSHPVTKSRRLRGSSLHPGRRDESASFPEGTQAAQRLITRQAEKCQVAGLESLGFQVHLVVLPLRIFLQDERCQNSCFCSPLPQPSWWVTSRGTIALPRQCPRAHGCVDGQNHPCCSGSSPPSGLGEVLWSACPHLPVSPLVWWQGCLLWALGCAAVRPISVSPLGLRLAWSSSWRKRCKE